MFLYFIFILINIFSSLLAVAQSDSFSYKDFDPKNKNEYEQVLELMQKERLALLDPGENPEEVLEKYIKALEGNPDKYYEGLRLKLLIQPKKGRSGTKVLGFICYQPQKENKKFPLLIRNIAIDEAYRRLGLAKYLLSEIEQEATQLQKEHICLAVYSNNRAMLNFLREKRFIVNTKTENQAFATLNTQTKELTLVYTYLMCKELKAKRF